MKLIEMKWNIMKRNETDMWEIKKKKKDRASKQFVNAMCSFDDEMKWNEMKWNEMKCAI